MREDWSSPRRGFSLVELLVVLTVVALLVGLLLPALIRARRAAQQVSCAGNLRQWAVAANLYALDNGGFLPRRGQGQQPTAEISRPSDWFNALPAILHLPTFQSLVAENQMPRPGTSSWFICPAASDMPNVSGYLFTYGMNMRLSTWDATLPDRIDKVGQPSTMVFMADAPGGYCSVLPFNFILPSGPGLPISPVARHQGRVNIAFLDAHVEAIPGAYVGCNVGDPQHWDVRWIVPGSTWVGPVQ